ncbi:MAG: 2-C-methyl-D-erythritol 4-phosphate cytidylyltransferase [Armatimonadota bacterium]
MGRPDASSRSSQGQVGAIVVAAGDSIRLPGDVPKPFLNLGRQWILERTLSAFEQTRAIDQVAVVVSADRVDSTRQRLGGKVAAVVTGGRERRDSVAAGLEVLPEAEWIVVHDGVRPFVTQILIDRVLDAARLRGASTAGLPVTDTLKEVERDQVRRTLDRSGLYLVQTPQAFQGRLLREAHRRVPRSVAVTDDAQLVEHLGGEVTMVPGDPANMKITTPADLELARRHIGDGHGADLRVGTGYDVHRLVPDRALVLGGVTIPSPRGLEGHSDADALTHAIVDALLGAAGLRDIGRHFPPDDPAYRNADSLSLLQMVAGRLRTAGWTVVNVDAVVLAEAPRLAPFADTMRERLAAALGLDPGQVGIKATTGKGLGPVGRGDGIAAQAVTLLRRLDEHAQTERRSV